MSGKFIAIVGVNCIGKSEQVNLLVEHIKSHGRTCFGIKYPVPGPTWEEINSLIRDKDYRKNHPISPLDLQKLFVTNRLDYQPQLLEQLHDGAWIIAEDYVGTGIAWGLTHRVRLSDLLEINKPLIEPDLCILLDGKRFDSANETDHLNESNRSNLDFCQDVFRLLGYQLYNKHLSNWKVVDNQGTMEEVHQRIVDELSSSLITWQVNFNHVQKPAYQ